MINKTILVTRAASQNRQFTDLLVKKGAKVIEMPTLIIVPPSNWHELDQSIANLSNFDWLILTSTNGVDYFWERLSKQNKNIYDLQHLKIAVVGQKTAQSLVEKGIKPDFIPPNFVADALVNNFPESPQGKKILFPRVESGGREVLVKEFSQLGAIVTEVSAYQSICPPKADSEALIALQNGLVDLITFASSKTVKHFHQLVVNHLPPNYYNDLLIASIGPQTSITCQEIFKKVDIEATEYTLPGLVRAIENYFA